MTMNKGFKLGKTKVTRKGTKIGRVNRKRLSTKNTIRGVRLEHDPLKGIIIERVTLALPEHAVQTVPPTRQTSPSPPHKKIAGKRLRK